MTTVAVILGTLALAANVVATWLLLRAEELETSQKLAQLALVWLVPIIGAVVVIAVRRESMRAYKPESSFPSSNITNNDAIDLAISSRRGSRHHESEAEPE